jgi:hypothetical protein
MRKARFTEKQIAYAMGQVEADAPVAELCRKVGVMAVTARVDPAVVIEPGHEPTVSGPPASNHSGVAERQALRGGVGGAVRRGDGDDQAAHAAIPGDRVRAATAARWRAEAQDPSRTAAPCAAAHRRKSRLGNRGTHRGVQPAGEDQLGERRGSVPIGGCRDVLAPRRGSQGLDRGSDPRRPGEDPCRAGPGRMGISGFGLAQKR